MNSRAGKSIGISEIKMRRKNFSEFYTRIFSCHISPYFTYVFLRFGIAPNTITYFMWAIGFLGAILIASQDSVYRIIGGFLLILINILDTSDGEVARISQRCSPFGVVLDKLAHFTTNMAIYFGLSHFYAVYGSSNWYYLVGAFLVLSTSLDDLIKELYLNQNLLAGATGASKAELSYDRKSLIGKFVHMMGGGTALYHILPVLTVIDLMFGGIWLQSIYLIYFVVVNFLKAIVRYKKVYKSLRNPLVL